MADYLQLRNEVELQLEQQQQQQQDESKKKKMKRGNTRLASLDVFRGLSVFLMIFVDYAGAILPSISHSPWNGVHLADFVMPFFLFIVGVSLALVYKNVQNKVKATYKAVIRATQLFLLGIFLQGGYFHGITSLTFGVDMESIRWLGILQRIALGYVIAALCEIWLPCRTRLEITTSEKYYMNWCVILALCIIHSGLLYGLYVSDWEFRLPYSAYSMLSPHDSHIVYMVKCAVRGDLGPACNAAGMIDRYILGVDHLYKKPVYRNLKECSSSGYSHVSGSQPPWCFAPFDPEGILSSLTAAVTCIIGLHYGHVLVQIEDHKSRLYHWLLCSFSLFGLGLLLTYAGIPLNKSLYSISYMLLTSASAGITFCSIYVLVDIYGYKHLTFVLEWMGIHSLGIFVLVSSNLAVLAIHGFYWKSPDSNIINWIVTRFVKK
ncbi:hypothetical protein AQUCO_07500025v1 [Aquilegia coerulea]|uniref:Heparan-alpha-glucosaminide N-acetyltransferase catalytic domain-containing protein n=1 Tax=Aquilegia coerulea TaxID=218851 RepID=A0A2G5C966_AQUCA|nr:hypothetical protein AQUCO_07500025v1 [Aquilegia coerulea]